MPKFRFSMNRDADGKAKDAEVIITLPEGTEATIYVSKDRISAEVEGDSAQLNEVLQYLKHEFPNWFPGLSE